MWKPVSEIGLKQQLNASDVKQIRLTNWLAFLSIAVSVIYLLAFLVYRISNPAIIELMAIGCYGIVLVLSNFQLFQQARFLFIISLFAHMIARSLCYGEASQIHLLLIPIATIPLILYDLKQKLTIVVLVCLGIISFLSLYVCDFNSPFFTELPEGLLKIIRFSSNLTAISTQGIVMFEIISNYEKNEKVLDENNTLLQQQLQSVFENSHDALFLVDWEIRKIIKANKRAVELFEMNSESDFNDKYGLDFHAESPTKVDLENMRQLVIETGKFEGEVLYNTNKGNQFWGALTVILISIGEKKYQSVRITDISEKKKNKLQIETSLYEKQILLSEIHHRVKNNMAVISGLLSLQANYVEDEKSKTLFLDSRNRIHSMALIHDKLYHNETFANIDFGLYINDLISQIEKSYNNNFRSEISFSVTCNNVLVDMKNAVPCGLILNELISNVYKHAFIDQDKGEVTIVCTKTNGLFSLTFRDNGKGFDTAKVMGNLTSLGLTLVSALVDQVSGTLEIENNKGTTYIISFKE